MDNKTKELIERIREDYSLDYFMDGDTHVVFETGTPADVVRIGVGETLMEAFESMEVTPVMSDGLDCGLLRAAIWADRQGWITVSRLT